MLGTVTAVVGDRLPIWGHGEQHLVRVIHSPRLRADIENEAMRGCHQRAPHEWRSGTLAALIMHTSGHGVMAREAQFSLGFTARRAAAISMRSSGEGDGHLPAPCLATDYYGYFDIFLGAGDIFDFSSASYEDDYSAQHEDAL